MCVYVNACECECKDVCECTDVYVLWLQMYISSHVYACV